MLPRARRIDRTLFERVQREGSIVGGTYFYARFLRTGAGPARAAAVAPRSSFRRAVDRNRMRRRMYVALQDLYPSLSDGYTLTVFARKGASNLIGREIRAHIQTVLKRVMRPPA